MIEQTLSLAFERISQLEQELLQVRKMLSIHSVANLTTAAARDTYLKMFRHSGLSMIDGMPIEEWCIQEMKLQRDAILLHFEDADPGAAALLQQTLDDSQPDN